MLSSLALPGLSSLVRHLQIWWFFGAIAAVAGLILWGIITKK